jgi:hypothetical protein
MTGLQKSGHTLNVTVPIKVLTTEAALAAGIDADPRRQMFTYP